MKKEFSGKVVLVTGGSRGIGQACCLAFARQDAYVVFTYNKSKKQAEQLCADIESFGVKAKAIAADVRSYDQCRGVMEVVVDEFEKIDVLINNAGITRDKALLMMMQDDWNDVMDTNLAGVFNMTRAGITTLLKQKFGCVINMSSVSGLIGLPRQTNYSASKAGIIGFSKALAKEVAGYNIRVNVVCPGYIETDMVEALRDDIKEEVVKNIPVKRIGRPEEVAELCVFLASDRAGYITGEVVKIDGGLAM